ncbi:MAG: hypothetical protein HYY23_02115 [Verrucomicrobia bacterium]|nr:hypothetical protein [Verrucomicrobiota bacterium]
MNTLVTPAEWAEGSSIQAFARETVDQWSELCQKFLDRQRADILMGNPSPEQLEQHCTALKWMLRFARALHLAASDPDYPDRRIADELEGRLIQLEHSWRMIHDRMSGPEADQLLKKVFPG